MAKSNLNKTENNKTKTTTAKLIALEIIIYKNYPPTPFPTEIYWVKLNIVNQEIYFIGNNF